MNPTWKQLRLPFSRPRETQAERCRRVLSGVPQVKRASSRTFTTQALPTRNGWPAREILRMIHGN